tara:strand:+ start:917 stop:1171 length:255 start_codon:yes stop_codon:yes gene_type:complete
MNKANVKIAQDLFKSAIDLMKQESYLHPENVSDEKVMANLVAKAIKWDCHDAYDVISMLLEEVNDREVAGQFNRINEVHKARWE